MCGRFSLTQDAAAIATAFGLDPAQMPSLSPRYNIAPSQPVGVVRCTRDHPQRQFTFLRWGLIPAWAQDPAIGSRLINARAETVTEKPSFRQAFKRRRCLVVADGFYEWQPCRDRKQKQPYYIHLQTHQPFGLAGLWEHWQGPNGEELETCNLLTTAANSLMQPIHDRMPVIIAPDTYDRWLDPNQDNPSSLQPLLAPFSESSLVAYAVGQQVNRPETNSPDCIKPLV